MTAREDVDWIIENAVQRGQIAELRAMLTEAHQATASMRRERDGAWKALNVKDATIAKQREEIERLKRHNDDEAVSYLKAKP